MSRGAHLAAVADEARFQSGPTRERLLSLLSPAEWAILEWEHGEAVSPESRSGQAAPCRRRSDLGRTPPAAARSGAGATFIELRR
jgi:hypothetical protein